MEIIEQIGAYAGLASVVGLAVLAALYFSQARDVRRLREWAGRAPERGPGPGTLPGPHQRVIAQPQRPVPHRVPSPAAAVAQGAARPAAPGPVPLAPGTTPPTGTAAPRPPVPAPGPVRAAAPGAAPPTATGPPTATPAAARVAAAEERDAAAGHEHERLSQGGGQRSGPDDGATQLDEGRGPGEDVTDERAFEQAEHDEQEHDEQELAEEGRRREEPGEYADDEYDAEGDYDEDAERDEEDAAEEDAEDGPSSPALAPPPPPTPLPPRPPIPARPPPPVLRSQPPQAPILPPYEQIRPGRDQPWYRGGLASRGGVVVIAASLFVVALLVAALLQLGGDEPAKPRQEQAARSGEGGDPGARGAGPKRGAAVIPARVTVSVLNGTTVGGLAAELGKKLAGQGFRLGNVTNSTDQQRAESVVLFAPGAEREAADVGRRLKIDQRKPIDPESQTLAGDAGVVVIAGADLTQ